MRFADGLAPADPGDCERSRQLFQPQLPHQCCHWVGTQGSSRSPDSSLGPLVEFCISAVHQDPVGIFSGPINQVSIVLLTAQLSPVELWLSPLAVHYQLFGLSLSLCFNAADLLLSRIPSAVWPCFWVNADFKSCWLPATALNALRLPLLLSVFIVLDFAV